MENNNIIDKKKSNTELLKEIQDIADAIEKNKDEVENLLNVIDDLERQYYQKTQEIIDNNKKK